MSVGVLAAFTAAGCASGSAQAGDERVCGQLEEVVADLAEINAGESAETAAGGAVALALIDRVWDAVLEAEDAGEPMTNEIAAQVGAAQTMLGLGEAGQAGLALREAWSLCEGSGAAMASGVYESLWGEQTGD